jgi:hypothetical protein
VRTPTGIVAVTALLTFAGLGLLRGTGFVGHTVRQALASLGLAYLAGAAAVSFTGVFLLTLGITFRLSVFTVVCLLIGAAGLWFARRRPTPAATAERGPSPGFDEIPRSLRLALVGLAVGAAIYAILWLLTFVHIPLHAWDSWSIWGRKAVILATSDGLPRAFFASDAYAFAHQDYPLLLPLLESVYFRAMGTVDTESVHAVFWLLLVSFIGALAYLGARVARPWVWAAVALSVLFAPLMYGQLSTGYADVPMSLFLALGALMVARWALSQDPRELALAALLLAAAAGTKREGAAFALAVLLAAIPLCPRPRRSSLVRLALAGLGVAVALAPWRIWVAVQGIEGDLPLARGIDPSYLWDRLDRVLPTIEALLREIPKQGGWLVPAAGILGVLAVALAGERGRNIAAFYLLAGTGCLASVVWSFMITRDSLDYQIGTSAPRVVIATVLLAAPAVLHLAGELDQQLSGRRATDGGSTR